MPTTPQGSSKFAVSEVTYPYTTQPADDHAFYARIEVGSYSNEISIHGGVFFFVIILVCCTDVLEPRRIPRRKINSELEDDESQEGVLAAKELVCAAAVVADEVPRPPGSSIAHCIPGGSNIGEESHSTLHSKRANSAWSTIC